jgi:signal transduction histidine kinase
VAFGKFAKYTPDQITFNPRGIDLVAELSTLFEFVHKEDGDRHRMIYQPAVTQLPLVTDPEHVKYIVINLLQNAIKYSAEGTTVSLLIEPQAAGGAEITVTDEGIGIPEDALGELFSPFYRANNVAERPGTGLGLAIVKRAARTIEAELDVHSELGKGTRFTARLPQRAGYI